MAEVDQLTKKRILIVEDEIILAKNLEDILTGLGYEIVGIADNSMKAIMQFFLHNPDLILMDIHLKGQDDGIKTAQKILEQKLVPIIYVTANQETSTFNRAKSSGAYGYVLKPFQERELQIVIEIAFSQFEDKVKILKLENVLSSVDRLNAIDTFASGVIHSINTSLTQIFIALDTLNKEEKMNINPAVITSLNMLKTASDSIRNILKNYLHFLDSIELEKPHTFMVYDILNEALEICKYYALSKNVLLKELKGSQSLKLNFSRSVLFLVVVNLIKTICDFLKKSEEPWLEVSWQNSENTKDIIITFSFNGETLGEEFANKMFDPFSKIDGFDKVNKFSLVMNKNLLAKYNAEVLFNSANELNLFIIKIKNT